MARHPWPHSPDEDDPPIGVSIRPLGPDQLPPLPPPPTPIAPALPEPTSRRTNVRGKPGASAMAQYRRRRAAEWTDYLRTLPLRLGAVAAAALLAGTLTRRTGLAASAAILAAAGLAFLLRFGISAEATAWRRGAKGEQLTARRLRRLGRGWTVFHDLAIPGSRANADHLAIGPSGLFLIDTKHYRGRLTLTPRRLPVVRPPPARPRAGNRPLGSRRAHTGPRHHHHADAVHAQRAASLGGADGRGHPGACC